MRHLRGLVTVLLLFGNLALGGIPVLLLGIVKRLLPGGRLRQRVTRLAVSVAERWVAGNDRILDARTNVVWDIERVDRLPYESHFVIISNHVSWVDIIALQRAFHGQLPFIRFFLKQELIWFPILGQACWAIDFPFMKRYSPEYLERHPEKRGTDLATTQRACAKFRHIPVAILNFLEGTRFTPAKHAEQKSPYRHLLQPRTGGFAFVVASLGDQLDGVLDVTLAYPGGDVTMWDLLTNRLARVTVRVRRVDVPADVRDPAITEPGPARDRFKEWLRQLWTEKDALLDSLTGAPTAAPPA